MSFVTISPSLDSASLHWPAILYALPCRVWIRLPSFQLDGRQADNYTNSAVEFTSYGAEAESMHPQTLLLQLKKLQKL